MRGGEWLPGLALLGVGWLEITAGTKEAPAPAVDHDREAWQSAEKCGKAACFRAYLEDYPKGRYAKMARARLEPKSESRPVAIGPLWLPRSGVGVSPDAPASSSHPPRLAPLERH